MSNPQVFISYSHDSEDHKSWVLNLASDLRENGVDAILDQWDLLPGQDISIFMQNGIRNSNRVIMVCSDNYVKRSENAQGGVGFERLIVTNEIIQSTDTRKFLPVVRNNGSTNKTPLFMGPRLYIDFDQENYATSFDKLIRDIHSAGLPAKPALGQNPFSGSIETQPPAKQKPSPTGRTLDGSSLLDTDWFNNEERAGHKGIEALHISGLMEVRLSPHDEFVKSQIELLKSVETANVKTFGWPIGIVLNSHTDYAPKPTKDGVRAEVSIPHDVMTGRKSYDYWSVRNNGDFYLLQNLFEDQRSENVIFFNTRIIRVAESFIFARQLYEKLGLGNSSRVSCRISHGGLRGRELTAVGNRHIISGRRSIEDHSQSEITITIDDMNKNLWQCTKRICEPMFMLFDFMEFGDNIYKDIVHRFENGETS